MKCNDTTINATRVSVEIPRCADAWDHDAHSRTCGSLPYLESLRLYERWVDSTDNFEKHRLEMEMGTWLDHFYNDVYC